MDGFTFRLQPLLKLREADRDQRREELAKAYHAERLLQKQLKEIKCHVEQTRRDLHRIAEPGEVNVDQLLSGHRYEMLLKLQQQELARRNKILLEEIERRRQVLVEADRELRILEKLRERKRVEYLECEQKLEIRRLDEVALRSYRSS